MSAWNEFWKGLIIVSMVSFAALSVFIMIGGFRDVRAMFRRIDRQHEQSHRGTSEPEQAPLQSPERESSEQREPSEPGA